MESHLLQMRGLKLNSEILYVIPSTVASFTDAWIETLCRPFSSRETRSHLLQMRGLKPAYAKHVASGLGRIFYRCVD